MTTRSQHVQAKHLRQTMRIGVVCALLWGAAHGVASGRQGVDLTLQDVVIRPDVRATIHLKVFVNDAHPCHGKVILAVPGFAHTAATWGPFAEALFAAPPGREKVCQLIAIDLPGHGGSSLPFGPLLFGDLTLGDYVTVLQSSLERLRATGLRPQVLLGHSQGGLLIQMTQQALKNIGTNLHWEFDIQHVVLMASVAPQPLPWAFVDNGTAAILLQQFVAFTPALGTHIAIPDAAWPAVFFSNIFGVIVPGAPTSEDIAAQGFNAPEPLLGAFELVGASPFVRPVVDARLFGPDSLTTLQVVAYEHDTLIRPRESALLYEHLTGDLARAGVVEVAGQEAVHDLHISDPGAILRHIFQR